MAQAGVYDPLRAKMGGNTGINPPATGGWNMQGQWDPSIPANAQTFGATSAPSTAATPGAAPNPGNGRESFHWEHIPDAYRSIPGIQQWANDPNIDPNQKVQEYLAGLRASGGKVAEDDAGAIAAATAPKNATPAQQWNAQPSAPASTTPSPMQQSHDDLFKLLMERAQQGTAVDRNTATVRNQVDPAVAQLERARRNYISDAAEARGPYANTSGEERMAAERFGQQAGLLEAQVIGREISARRDEISEALQMWGSLLSNDQRLALEKELAQLNDAARTADRNQQSDQFEKDLALREYDLDNAWQYRWLLGG